MRRFICCALLVLSGAACAAEARDESGAEGTPVAATVVTDAMLDRVMQALGWDAALSSDRAVFRDYMSGEYLKIMRQRFENEPQFLAMSEADRDGWLLGFKPEFMDLVASIEQDMYDMRAIRPALAGVLAAYRPEEIDEIVRFYESPAGVKSLSLYGRMSEAVARQVYSRVNTEMRSRLVDFTRSVQVELILSKPIPKKKRR